MDRRFGETDAHLSLEDKMAIRFQKEKIRKTKSSSIFNMDEGKVDYLTHGGKLLGESNLNESRAAGSDDEDDDLGKDIVSSLHFGGGFVKKPETAGSTAPSRLDAFHEIIANSKLQKAQKKEMKEEQDHERERLDEVFAELMQESVLDLRPKKMSRKDEDKSENAADWEDAYDQSLMEVSREEKIRASDRTQTPEEMAVSAKAQLVRLEKLRLERMKRVPGGDDEEEDEDQDNADGEGRNSHSSTALGMDALDTENRSRYWKVRQLKKMKKLNMNNKKDQDDSREDSENEEDEDDEDDSENDPNSDEEEEEEEEDEDDYEIDDYEQAFQERSLCVSDTSSPDDDTDKATTVVKNDDNNSHAASDDSSCISDSDDSSEDSNSSDDDSEGETNKKPNPSEAPNKSTNVDVNEKMPHQINCPQDFEELESLLNRYVNHAKDFDALVERILVWNSLHLPGEEGQENRQKLMIFQELLVKLLIQWGNALPTSKNPDKLLDRLKVLYVRLFQLCQDLPEPSLHLWTRTLKGLQSQTNKKRQGFWQGEVHCCWPSLGQLFFLQFTGKVFSVSDYRHAIVSSTSLWMSQCLTQLPVRSGRDLSASLFMVGILLEYHAEAHRWIPEVWMFLTSLWTLISQERQKFFLKMAGKKGKKSTVEGTYHNKQVLVAKLEEELNQEDDPNILKSLDRQALQPWLNFVVKNDHFNHHSSRNLIAEEGVSGMHKIQWECFGVVAEQEWRKEWMVSWIDSLEQAIQNYVNPWKEMDGFPEIVYPLLLQDDAMPSSSKTPDEMTKDENTMNNSGYMASKPWLLEIQQIVQKTLAQRSPLQWRKATVEGIESKAPKYEIEFHRKKINDPDEDRSTYKQLKKELKQSQKTAMRDIRRDNEFLDQVRYREKTEASRKRQLERQKNFHWLESQQAVLNMQVRKDRSMVRGGGSGVAKRPRVR